MYVISRTRLYLSTQQTLTYSNSSQEGNENRGLFSPDLLRSKEESHILTVEELGGLPQLPSAQTNSETPTPTFK